MAADSALSILVIRHAEKPGEQWPGPGFSEDGTASDRSLVLRGWQRAGAWAALFGSSTIADYPAPNVIYAAQPDRDATDPAKVASPRPHETVTPLAARLSQRIISHWAVGEEAQLAAEAGKLTGVVLVCWEHKRIVTDLLPAFIGSAAGLPPEWPSDRYDVVLRLDRRMSSAHWRLTQLFPLLLSGDSDRPLASGG